MQMTFPYRRFRPEAASFGAARLALELVETGSAIGPDHALAGRLMP